MNLCLRQLLVRPRLGARTGGSGRPERTRKWRPSSSAVVREYTATTTILPALLVAGTGASSVINKTQSGSDLE